MRVVTAIASVLALALSVAACTKPTATGSYSKTDANVALLIDLVEDEQGKLSGRVEEVMLMTDGSVQDRNFAVEGQADGEHLSLTIKTGDFLAQPVIISVERNGDELHISGKGLDGSVKRQSLKTFEDGVKAIRAKATLMIAANARAAAAATQSRSLYQLKFDIKNLKDQIGVLLGRVDRLKPKSQELIAAFSRQSKKVEWLLTQERSLADVAERGQVRFAISQVVTDTERQIDEIVSGGDGLTNAIRDANKGAKQIFIRCAAPQFAWMRAERAKLSRHNGVAKALDYMLTRWPAFTRVLDDGRICLTNNAAERALRGLALGRKSWLFAGSARGAERAAVMYTLIQTAKLNDVDPQAWLADVLSRIAETPQSRLGELLPWKWTTARLAHAA